MRRAFLSILLATSCFGSAFAAEAEVVFLAGAHHTMPLSQFDQGVLSTGIVKDIGEAIAQRLGRRARFVTVPPRRVAGMLQAGAADSVCFVMPGWIDGDFRWTQPLIPVHGVLVARTNAPAVRRIADLAGKPIGTVAAYRYTSFEAGLGKQFVRDDAPFMANNVQKLLAGRMQYAIMEKMTYDYLMRGAQKPPLRADLEFDPVRAQCAFSRKSAISFAKVEQAVKGLLADGTIEKILARYR